MRAHAAILRRLAAKILECHIRWAALFTYGDWLLRVRADGALMAAAHNICAQRHAVAHISPRWRQSLIAFHP